VVGNLLQIRLPRLHLQLEHWARELGDLYTLQLLGKRQLVVGNTALIQEILQARPDDYRRWTEVEPMTRETGTFGVFSAEGSTWKTQRKLVMPAFSMRQLRELYPTIAVHTERLRSHWLQAAASKAVVDVRADLMRFAVDVTSRIVFGHDLNTLEGHHSELQGHLSRMFSAANQRITAPFPYWRYVKLPRDRALDRSLKIVHALLRELIAARRAALARDPFAPKTLLEAMLAAQQSASAEERLSDEEITGNVLTLLIAGEDTTSNTLTWMLYYMAYENGVQTQLQAEVDAHCGSQPALVGYEAIAKLRYASALTQETLRLKSAAPLVLVEPTRTLKLGGWQLPAGTKLYLLTRHAAMSADNFHQSHAFMPERWLEGTAAAECPVHRPRSMLAFGGGPRTCPGRALALLECAMVSSMVARNFTLEGAAPRDSVDEVFDFTMVPRGVRLRFRARELAS